MKNPHLTAPVTVRAGGVTALYMGKDQWAIKSRRLGQKAVSHRELLGLLPDHTRSRRPANKKGGK
jgi:hypothetical protein